MNGTSAPVESSTATATQMSQQLSSLNGQSIQLEEPSMYINSESQQVPLSTGEPAWLGAAAMPFFPSLQHFSSLNGQQLLHLEQPPTISAGMNSQNLSLANKQVLVKEQSPKFQNVMRSSARPLQQFSTQKQLDEMKFLPHPQGSMFLNLGSQQLSTKSKQTVHREPWPKIISAVPVNMGSHQLSSAQKGTGQLEQSPKSKKSAIGNASLQKSSSINKRATQSAPSPKARTESFESVRAKMRESLAASLAMVSDEKSKSESEGKNPPSVDIGNVKLAEMCTQPSDPSSLVTGSSSCNTLGCPPETSNLSQNDSQKSNECGEVQDSQQKNASLEEDEATNENFGVNDELLQGNGLSWVSDLDVEKDEARENHDSKRPKLSPEKVSTNTESPNSENPQSLAAKIEAELFKLYGGVNKKYKEKGRSLLFNLKDRSNPELRKQVLSGDIAPERLCSMTAEELASKELSEWRIAKAEELAQMVVLPDSELDMRRLVKKTHKGEFQVEVELERDDTASMEVTFGATSFLQTSTKSNVDEVQTQVKSNKRKAQMLSKSNGTDHPDGSFLSDKIDLVDETFQNNLTDIPHEKTDYMQDIIMDELKDEELLEQVPSLDEFMKDLDSEPPFKNLTVDIVQVTTISDEKTSDCLETKSDAKLGSLESKLNHAVDSLASNQNHVSVSSELIASSALASSVEQADFCLKDPVIPADLKSSEMDATHKGSESNLISSSIPMDSNTQSTTVDHNANHMWEGVIQLNISSLVTVLGSYKSGEQTSTKDWPSLLEIKGRVRLDAFEKFLQELPLSRSRAIMILQFCWKEGSPESGRVSLSETIDSYITDERVGYAEPAPGVEIYFCPPHEKTNQILVKQLPKEHEEILMSTDNGLIGVVVWRRANVISTISPRPSSHLKHNSKKQSVSRKHQNTNTNFASTPHSQMGHVSVNQNQLVEEEPSDDAPPGFGPRAAKDEDDLPEFDYAQSNKLSASRHKPTTQALPPARPVEQMRQLIHKYGHSESRNGTGIRVNAWNDDEDDDIPEWQPHRDVQSHPPPPLPPPPQLQAYQQQVMQPNTERQHLVMVPQQQQQLQQPMMHLPNVVPQQLVPIAAPLSMPLQHLQPPMAVLGAQIVHPTWQQQGQWWAPTQEPMGLPANGMMQPYNYGGPLPAGGQPGQAYALPGVAYPQDGVEWRHDVHRNR